jgi:hypothetical protein
MSDAKEGKEDSFSNTLYEKHINVLREAQLNDNLAIFVGAGISKATNDDYPSWGNVIEVLKQDLVDNNGTGIRETDPLKIAQLFFLEYGEYHTKKKVRAQFPSVDKAGPI